MDIILLLFAFWDYSYVAESDISYNNNVFNYSSSYIAEFMDQIRPYRFPFETYDDLITSVKLHLRIRNKFFARRTTTLNIDVNLHHHLVNQSRDHQYVAGGIRQSFGAQALKLTYSLIPHYLIRYYRDPLNGTHDYIGCAVAYHTAELKFSWGLNPALDLALQYRRKWDDYIAEFNQYDARSHVAGIEMHLSPAQQLTLFSTYEFRSSTTDSAALATGVDDIPDGAFVQNTIEGGCALAGTVIKPGEFKVAYRYTFRNYTSEDELDIMHFGRQDHNHRIELDAAFSLILGMQGICSYRRSWRIATSEIFPMVHDVKNYDTYEITGGLVFQY